MGCRREQTGLEKGRCTRRRLGALVGLTAFYVLALVVLGIAFKRYLKRQPKPFSATIQELKEDVHVSDDGAE